MGSVCACQSDKLSQAEAVHPAAGGEVRFEPGALAPDFELLDLAGDSKRLSDFRSKVVMLNFWATWCAPCVAEIPSMQMLYDRFADRGFEVVSINIDSSKHWEQVKQLVKDQGLTFTVLRDEKLKIVAKYGVSGFPETFFIDREGRFLEVRDPHSGVDTLRFLSDRPWSAKEYSDSIDALLSQPLNQPEAHQ
jgi:peroxiredoxin